MPPERFRVAAALPPDGGWRSELALDRETSPPRPVALARVPPAVSGDATALAALARGVDLASRLTHPSVGPVLGLVELGGGLAVAAPFREGETLRAVLDGGGALTPALASRVVVDVARAVQAVHALAAAGPRVLAHGAVRADAVLIAEDGTVLLTGLGRPLDPPALPSDDLKALPRLLAECLAPGGGAVAPELAPFTADGAVGDGAGAAGQFADALAAAAPPATPGALVARVDSAIPKGAAARASRRRALAQALLAEAGGEPGAATAPTPSTTAPTSSAPPALSPPPFRTPLAIPATTPRPGAVPPAAPGGPPSEPVTRPTLSPPPLAARAVAVSAPAEPAGPPDALPTALPRPAEEGPGAPAPATLLDDPRLPARLALALALVGLVLGLLLGRR